MHTSFLGSVHTLFLGDVVIAQEFVEWLKSLSRKWWRVWEEAKVYEAEADPSKPKLFVTAAFMYPNSPAHMGHARTYLVADVIARFWRARGYNVLFPMGFHYTGTPIIAMAERVASGDRAFIEVLIKRFDVPPELVEKMKDPLFMARYFHEQSKETFKLYGLSIDWRREFTTIDPEFRSFIHWQFRRLAEKGFVVQGTHPVGWCPKHGMPVGAHDTQGDVEPDIGEFVAIEFVGDDGVVYPTATLRPETVFGVTNIWINPSDEYVVIELENGRRWVVGARAAERLQHQMRFRIIDRFAGEKLVGKFVKNPVTGEKVPILPAKFVDSSFATGVVMSVPAHAPYDAAALEDLKKGVIELSPELRKIVESIEPRVLIEVPELGKVPAYEALARVGASSQLDREKLDEATKLVYSTELARGRMLDLKSFVPSTPEFRDIVEKVSGVDVQTAREIVKNALLERGAARIVYEIMNRPVFCRCGAEVVVKLLENQWFLDYGNPEWKKLARELLNSLKLVPEESRAQFEATIEWLRRRACARTRGLGVPLPWDPTWIIESLSDSTIYMAFYTVIHLIRSHGIEPSKLDDSFWNYVLLGIGDPNEIAKRLGVEPSVIERIRREFDYWYPLDWRVSGKDLIPNHLTFFIFNHAALFPREKWPRGIVANGWVLLRGGKMSKSRGNIVLLKDLVEHWGADVARLAMATGAEVPQDFEISDDLMKSSLATLQRVVETFERVTKILSDRACTELVDRWFLSEAYELFDRAAKNLENIRIRTAAIELFNNFVNLVDRYLSMVEKPCRDVVDVLRGWIVAISIYTPFLAEELWHRMGNESLVVTERWPEKKFVDEEALLAMEFVEQLIEDVRSIARATGIEKPKRIVLYVYPRQAYEVLRMALEGRNVRDLGSKLVELGIPKERAYQVAQRVLRNVRELRDRVKQLLAKVSIDEAKVLEDVKDWLRRVLSCETIEVYLATDPNVPDLKGKKFSGTPFRPGIYVE